MKLTDANVYKLEHKIIQELDIWSLRTPEEIRDVLYCIAGINMMADDVVEALQEVKNV